MTSSPVSVSSVTLSALHPHWVRVGDDQLTLHVYIMDSFWRVIAFLHTGRVRVQQQGNAKLAVLLCTKGYWVTDLM